MTPIYGDGKLSLSPDKPSSRRIAYRRGLSIHSNEDLVATRGMAVIDQPNRPAVSGYQQRLRERMTDSAIMMTNVDLKAGRRGGMDIQRDEDVLIDDDLVARSAPIPIPPRTKDDRLAAFVVTPARVPRRATTATPVTLVQNDPSVEVRMPSVDSEATIATPGHRRRLSSLSSSDLELPALELGLGGGEEYDNVPRGAAWWTPFLMIVGVSVLAVGAFVAVIVSRPARRDERWFDDDLIVG